MWNDLITDSDKKILTRLAILYRALECGETYPLFTTGRADIDFIQGDLTEMSGLGLLDIKGEELVPTAAGKAKLGKAIQMLDQVRQFEIFRQLRPDRELGLEESKATPEQVEKGEAEAGDLYQVRDHLYDPRFVPPNVDDPEAVDCRLAIMAGLAECLSGQQIKDQQIPALDLNPYQVVFLQMLGKGRFAEKDFWFTLRLGKFFNDAEYIVKHSFKWRNFVPGDEDASRFVLGELYKAGLLEQRKRDGHDCPGCKIALGVFEMNARQEGKELTKCPNPDCKTVFTPPPAPAQEAQGQMACGRCGTILSARQRKCRSCGVYIDRSGAAPGTETTWTEQHQEMVSETVGYDYGYSYVPAYGYYGIEPYGYYYPYDPIVDALAFVVLCDLLF